MASTGLSSSDQGQSYPALYYADRDTAVTARRREIAEEVKAYFEEWRGPIYAYLYSSCRRPERAEEMTQEIFLRLFAYLEAGHQIANVRYWLFRVAHNLTINESRKLRLEVAGPVPVEDWCERTDPMPDPEQLLLRNEETRLFWRGLALLTDHQRRCLLLRAEGLPTQQIAEVLKISRTGVVDTLQRAIKRIRKAVL